MAEKNEKPDLSVITMTGDRWLGFTYCIEYMRRQTFAGSVQWIIVDDGDKPTFDGRRSLEHLPPTMRPEVTRLSPVDTPRESFRRNLLIALEQVKSDRIVFVEDDDWYSPHWLSICHSGLLYYERVGERYPTMFNVRHRQWKTHLNHWHSSLCSTAIRSSVIEPLVNWLNSTPRPETTDGTIWNRLGLDNENAVLYPGPRSVIGIKGMPGRGGLGIGHSPAHLSQHAWTDDLDLETLKQFIGDDVEKYYDCYQTPEDPAGL